ncbi:MAG: GNAT family N-acetyltransferase [Acidimicrobiales bacterium]
MDVTLVDEPDAERFAIRVDGAAAGEITYVFRHDRRIITHTGVDDAFGGQGVGGRAAAALLDLLRERGETIVPLCPFVRAYIERHPEYDDLVDHELDERYHRPED